MKTEYAWQDIALMLEEAGYRKMHNRVFILPDEASEFFGDTKIVRPETFKTEPLMGTIVQLGDGDEVPKYLKVGSHVQFNKYNLVYFQFNIEGKAPFQLVSLHIKDLYVYNNEINNV